MSDTLDFRFACEGADGPDGPWGHLLVARLRGREAIGRLYRYEIVLLMKGLGLDPADLAGKRATLRLATLSSPELKVVHGVIAEVQEITELVDGRLLRVILAPPWTRARHEKRSRIFLGKTLRQIVEAVLQDDPKMQPLPGGEVDDDPGGPDFSPAEERFAWRIKDASRLDDTRVRSYVVQYGESDHDFVARLLEEEGIGYHFENGAERCLLVLTDNDSGRSRLAPALVGPVIAGRQVKELQLGARLRTHAVTLDDYNWKKPSASMIAEPGEQGGADLTEYAYPGGYPDKSQQGVPLATARLERYGSEARYAVAEGTIRVLSAGSIFELEHPKARYEGEYLVTELRVAGEQTGVATVPSETPIGVPFEAWFECARRGKGTSVDESHYRPARFTPRPRILGTQTAIVTTEPSRSSEINVGGPDGLSVGCVRLRFHWDDDKARHAKEPTSCWVRVSQAFAGAGEGAVWHPRIGVEVIVDFEEGDPDRPLVVGRVYNGKNLPPYGGSSVHSTLKSFASPGGGVHNEMTFDDSAGKELVYMNAGKDMTTLVGNDRLEAVAANAKMMVGADDTETIGANEAITIGVNDTLAIGANDTLTVGANSTTSIGANCTMQVGANETKVIGASQTITVGATLTETAGAAVTETYASTRDTTVAGAVTETLGATRDVTVAGSNTQTYGPHGLQVASNRDIDVGATLSTTVNGTVFQLFGGNLSTDVTGSQTSNVSAGMLYISPSYTLLAPDGTKVDNLHLKITGLGLAIVGAEANAAGLSLGLTGVAADATGINLKIAPIKIRPITAKIQMRAVKVSSAGFWMHMKAFTCIV